MSPQPGPLLVIGDSAGQLATALMAGSTGLQLLGRPQLDFDRTDAIIPALRAVAPSLVVNSAAYTAVDRAETEADAAYRANRDGPAALAAYCAEAGIPLIHVSTDYVFDGLKGAPYVETDPPSPTGVYGASKLAGEQAVLAACPRAIILRTSWVYAATGRNFVLTMLAARARTDRLRVVADQIGCPTTAPDLAQVILAIAARIREHGWDDRYAGLFHAAGTGSTSWHGLATAVFEEAARFGMTPPTVEPIATADWPTPVRRPADSRLDCSRLAATFGLQLPDWRDSLSTVITEVFSRGAAPDPARGFAPGPHQGA
jgi:dTDP-4-dehydrorhamnose reductase